MQFKSSFATPIFELKIISFIEPRHLKKQ